MTSNDFPDFYIPGAPKCGTTSLAGWLLAHPMVGFSQPKEPRFFNTDFSLRGRPQTAAEYLSLFPPRPPGGLRGEATTGYLVSAVAIDAILRVRPDAKFVVCLREPAELFLSLHRQRLKEGYETLADPRMAWEASAARCRGEGVPALCPDRQMLDYRRYCAIGDQVETLETRAPGRMLIVLTHELRRAPQATFDRVCDFLGLPPVPIGGALQANAAQVPRSLAVARLLRALGILRHRLGLRHGFGIARRINRLNLKNPDEHTDTAFRAELSNALAPQWQKVLARTGFAAREER